MVGKPVIKGTRIPVYLIVDFIANGMKEEEVLKEYPQLRKEDIKAALLIFGFKDRFQPRSP